MKDIIDEIDSRIKSPLFGYFALSLAAINWSELFYLFLSNSDISERIAHFKENTDALTLVVYPFLVAAVYAIIYPWLQYLFVLFGVKPTSLKNNIQARSEHSLLIEKQKLEEARSELLRKAEAELIERAKRDSSIDEIEDKNIRGTLKSEIEQLRRERDKMRSFVDPNEKENHSGILKEQNNILLLIAKNEGKMFLDEIIRETKYSTLRVEYYLEDLEEKGYLNRGYYDNSPDEYYYELTTKSKKIIVEAGLV